MSFDVPEDVRFAEVPFGGRTVRLEYAFWGWNEVWCDPVFRASNIEALLPRIGCPVLAVQGEDDEYGTLAQVHALRRWVPQTEVAMLPRCGHSPYRDQPDLLASEVLRFFARHFRGQGRRADR